MLIIVPETSKGVFLFEEKGKQGFQKFTYFISKMVAMIRKGETFGDKTEHFTLFSVVVLLLQSRQCSSLSPSQQAKLYLVALLSDVYIISCRISISSFTASEIMDTEIDQFSRYQNGLFRSARDILFDAKFEDSWVRLVVTSPILKKIF
jgi:hypothetical protein